MFYIVLKIYYLCVVNEEKEINSGQKEKII